MAKIYFKWGCMGSGKSLDLIRSKYNYIERGMDVLTYKPRTDTRNGIEKCEIVSRTGAKTNGEWLLPTDNIFLTVHREIERNDRNIKAIFIDEVQFCTPKQIDEMLEITLKLNIPVLAYGLKTDFQSHMFPSIIRLFEICEDIQEIRSICWCGKRALQNCRIHEGEIVRQGEQIEIGGNDKYIALCTKHFMEGKLR